MANRTTIIITQRLSTLKLADRIVVFDQGRVVEQGTHEELFSLDGYYTRLFNAQFAPQDVSVEELLVDAAEESRNLNVSNRGGAN